MPPHSPDLAAADLAACRDLLRKGSRSFAAASLLLPGRVRAPVAALYAFCRVADDAIDVDGGAAALDGLRDRVERAYAGSPADSPIDRAFSRVVREHALPRELMEALLEGLAWDAEGRRYESLSELTGYAARVAGSVGAMMTVLMGVRAPEVLARACDLGVAMQLTNIARDVGEDAHIGRLYLPREWLREAGVGEASFLARPQFSPGVAAAVARVLDHARALYGRAEPGIAMLPRDCRAAIRAASRIYAEIGCEVERRGFDSIGARAVVPGRRKLWLVVRALLARDVGAQRLGEPPALAETQFLVDAVTGAMR